MRDPEAGLASVSMVKVGADGKEKALLLRASSLRWIAIAVFLLIGSSGGAWWIFSTKLEGHAEKSRLTALLRHTGERIQALHRVRNAVEKFDGANAKAVEKLDTEVSEAEEQHRRAQAAMMKQQGMPDTQDIERAGHAAERVPKAMQVKMLDEFQVKASFLVWATEPERAAVWRKSPQYNKMPSKTVVEELGAVQVSYETGGIDTRTFVGWCRGNVTAGNWPPPVSSLQGIINYFEDLTDDPPEDQKWEGNTFVTWEHRMTKFKEKKHATIWETSHETIKKLLAQLPDDATRIDDPIPAFKFTYAALTHFHLTEWLFPADDAEMDDAFGAASSFAPYSFLVDEEQDDDDSEFDMEWDEEDDDDAEGK